MQYDESCVSISTSATPLVLDKCPSCAWATLGTSYGAKIGLDRISHACVSGGPPMGLRGEYLD